MISRQYTVNITSEHADGRYGTTHQWMWIGGAPETSIPAHLYQQHLTEACYRYGRATAVDGGMGCVSIDLDSGTSPATFATPHRETLTPEQIARYMPNPKPKPEQPVYDPLTAAEQFTVGTSLMGPTIRCERCGENRHVGETLVLMDRVSVSVLLAGMAGHWLGCNGPANG